MCSLSWAPGASRLVAWCKPLCLCIVLWQQMGAECGVDYMTRSGEGDTAESLLVLLFLATNMFNSWHFGFSTHIPFNFPFKPSLCKAGLSYRKGHGDICTKSGSTCRHQDCHSSTSKGLGVWQWEFTASCRQAHPWHCAVDSSAGVLCKMLRTGCRESFAVYVCMGCI